MRNDYSVGDGRTTAQCGSSARSRAPESCCTGVGIASDERDIGISAHRAPRFLANHTLRDISYEALASLVGRHTTRHSIRLLSGEIDGFASSATIGDVDLAFVRYGADVAVELEPSHPRISISVPFGPISMWARSERTDASYRAVMTRPFAIDPFAQTLCQPHPSAGTLVITVSQERLDAHMRAIGGKPSRRGVDFSYPKKGGHAVLTSLLNHSWMSVATAIAQLGAGNTLPAALIRSLEMELLSGILFGVPHADIGDLLRVSPHGGLSSAEAARQWMEKNHARDITIPEIARAVGLSARQLQSAVSRQFGMTPTEMLFDVRMEAAHRIILSERSNPLPPSVGDVAYRSGFRHLSRFAVAYRTRFGVRPSEALRGSQPEMIV